MLVVGEGYVCGVEAFAFQVEIVRMFGVIIRSFCFMKEVLFERDGFKFLECRFLLYSALFSSSLAFTQLNSSVILLQGGVRI
jgi:hypothetical protein